MAENRALMTMNPNLLEARRRIAACLMLDAQGNLVQRQDHLNLAGLGLSTAELVEAFDPQERGLPCVSFADLVHLRYLDLSKNALTELPECVCEMTGLEWLGVNFNRLGTLPEKIGQLLKLKRLYVRGNRLKTLPERFGGLTQLLELDLNGNEIEELPPGFAKLLPEAEEKGARPGVTSLHLDISENPGQVAAAAQGGLAKLGAFLNALQEEKGHPQGKLLLVGEGRVGKSSLLRAIFDLKHDPDLLSTHGLRIESWHVDRVPGHAQPVRLNCWDFSGQEQMRETHQMFFTAPALYLLVWDPDKNQRESEDQLHQWLWLIHQSQREGARARVLVVATNHRSRDRHEPDNKALLWEEFGPEGADILTGFTSVESDDQRGARHGIDEVKDWVRQQIAAEGSFAQPVPGDWERVIEKITDSGTPVLDWTDYEKACRKHSSRGQTLDVEALTCQMHALGRVVWYADDPALRAHVILRPDWLSKAISYVFERSTLAATPGEPETPLGPGLVSRRTMDALWTNPGTTDESGTPEPGYAKKLFPVFRRLMRRFDLLQPLPSRSIARTPDGDDDDEADHYLVPARLGREQPANWDSGWTPTDTIALRWSLTSRGLREGDASAPLNAWLARAVFGRLVVWLHPLAQGREHVQHAAHWERGLRLRDTALGEARICAEKDLLFFEGTAHMHGQVLHALRGLLEEMNRRFGTRMRFTEAVGCQPAAKKKDACPTCTKPLPQRRYFAPTELKNLLQPEDEDEEPQLKFPCAWDGCTHKIDVLRSLHGVTVPTSHMEAKLDGLYELANQLSAGFQALVQAFHASRRELSEELRTEIRQQLPLWKTSITDALRQHDADVTRHGPGLFSLQTADGHSFWTDLGPRLADKLVLHVHCEHTLLPASWFKHEGKEAPGAFKFEKPKPWLVKAAPTLKGISRLLTAGAPFAAAMGAADFSLLLKNPTDSLKALPEELLNKPAQSFSKDASSDWNPRQAQEATGETLKQLHQFLQKELKAPDLAHAPGLGLVRVWNNILDHHSWVHPLYAHIYGGEV